MKNSLPALLLTTLAAAAPTLGGCQEGKDYSETDSDLENGGFLAKLQLDLNAALATDCPEVTYEARLYGEVCDSDGEKCLTEDHEASGSLPVDDTVILGFYLPQEPYTDWFAIGGEISLEGGEDGKCKFSYPFEVTPDSVGIPSELSGSNTLTRVEAQCVGSAFPVGFDRKIFGKGCTEEAYWTETLGPGDTAE